MRPVVGLVGGEEPILMPEKKYVRREADLTPLQKRVYLFVEKKPVTAEKICEALNYTMNSHIAVEFIQEVLDNLEQNGLIRQA